MKIKFGVFAWKRQVWQIVAEIWIYFQSTNHFSVTHLNFFFACIAFPSGVNHVQHLMTDPGHQHSLLHRVQVIDMPCLKTLDWKVSACLSYSNDDIVFGLHVVGMPWNSFDWPGNLRANVLFIWWNFNDFDINKPDHHLEHWKQCFQNW